MNYESGGFDRETLVLEGPARPWWRRPKVLAAVGAAVIAVVALFFLLHGRGEEAAPASAPAAADQAPRVTVIVPGRSPVDRVLTANGTLSARREMPVGVAGEGGMVTRVLVDAGQWVNAGQVLATVDRSVQTQTAAQLAAQVNVARSDVVLAQQELERAQQLVDRGFISKADVQRRTATRDAAQARLKVAQAAASEQRARNSRLDIRAPASGLILTRGVEPGQIVSSASGTLFRMARGGEMEMQARLSEGDLIGLPTGARATVTPVGTDDTFSGEVWQVSPVIDPQTRQGVARIALKYNAALRPGGFASASIFKGASDTPQLPQSAVLSDERGNFVYIINAEDKVERRPVTLGNVGEDSVAIASGLQGNERVVLSAGAFLNPGQKVRPVTQASRS